MLKKLFFVLCAVFIIAGVSLAATHTDFVTGNPVYDPKDNEVFIISNTLDFADLTTGGNSGVTGGDVVQLLDIPAGTIVKNVGIYIYSAWSTSGATCPGVTIGDGSDANGWLLDVDFGPTASGVSASSGNTTYDTYKTAAGVTTLVRPAYYKLGGKYYSTADTIDAVIPTITHLDGHPGAVSSCSDFQLMIWAEAIKPSTQNAYGSIR